MNKILYTLLLVVAGVVLRSVLQFILGPSASIFVLLALGAGVAWQRNQKQKERRELQQTMQKLQMQQEQNRMALSASLNRSVDTNLSSSSFSGFNNNSMSRATGPIFSSPAGFTGMGSTSNSRRKRIPYKGRTKKKNKKNA